MALRDQIEDFRSIITRIVEQLEEVNTSSAKIPSTEADQLGRRFSDLSESLDDTERQLKNAIEELDSIRSQWG